MEIETRTADQVRVPRVEPDRAIVVTRHGEAVCAIVDIEDFRILERWKDAMAATRPAPVPLSEAALALLDDDDDDEFPDDATVARILGERP